MTEFASVVHLCVGQMISEVKLSNRSIDISMLLLLVPAVTFHCSQVYTDSLLLYAPVTLKDG